MATQDKRRVFDKDGFKIDEKGRRIAQDGQIIKVPMLLTDRKLAAAPTAGKEPIYKGGDTRPHPVITDADRKAKVDLQDAYDRRTSNAWRQGADLPEGA